MKRQKQTQFNSCNTGVNPLRTHGRGIWGNRRVVMGIRIDEKLKIEATKVLKAIYGSTCRGIEAYLAGLVATYHSQIIEGVNPSNTRVDIGTIRIERNVKTRRRLVVEEETETVMEEVRQRKEDVEVERVFVGVLDQWESLKPSAKRYHLRKAREYSYLKSAQLLLSLVEC